LVILFDEPDMKRQTQIASIGNIVRIATSCVTNASTDGRVNSYPYGTQREEGKSYGKSNYGRTATRLAVNE
jgi:hypothetical protein